MLETPVRNTGVTTRGSPSVFLSIQNTKRRKVLQIKLESRGRGSAVFTKNVFLNNRCILNLYYKSPHSAVVYPNALTLKKKKKTNTIFKNKTHTLKLEGPGGSALIASIVLAVPHESLLQLFLKLLLSFSILVHPCG